MNTGFFVQRIILVSFLMSSLFSCRSENAKTAKYQFVRVYTDIEGLYDDEIIRKFEKEAGVDVHFFVLPTDSLIKKLNVQKYSSGVDVILFSNAQVLPTLVPSLCRLKEDVYEGVDVSYVSRNHKWIALAKSPIVLCANKQLIDPRSIKYFADLRRDDLKGQLLVSEYGTSSIDVFEKSYREMKTKDIDSFFVHFYKNRYVVKGADAEQINYLKRGIKAVGIIELSSFLTAEANVKQDSLSKREFSNLQIILPAQNKKGAIYNIHGGGVYKYAENKQNAFSFLKFISSKKAQYKYASGRYSFPVLQGVEVNYQLQSYKRLRARFYKSAFE